MQCTFCGDNLPLDTTLVQLQYLRLCCSYDQIICKACLLGIGLLNIPSSPKTFRCYVCTRLVHLNELKYKKSLLLAQEKGYLIPQTTVCENTFLKPNVVTCSYGSLRKESNPRIRSSYHTYDNSKLLYTKMNSDLRHCKTVKVPYYHWMILNNEYTGGYTTPIKKTFSIEGDYGDTEYKKETYNKKNLSQLFGNCVFGGYHRDR